MCPKTKMQLQKRHRMSSERELSISWRSYKCDIRSLLKKWYIGLAEGEWQSLFYNRKLSFKHRRYSNKTTLSTYMWHVKSVWSEAHHFKWSVLRCIPPSHISETCQLCLYEKLEMVTYQNHKELLNKISELPCKYHHANKFLLGNYAGNDFR